MADGSHSIQDAREALAILASAASWADQYQPGESDDSYDAAADVIENLFEQFEAREDVLCLALEDLRSSDAVAAQLRLQDALNPASASPSLREQVDKYEKALRELADRPLTYGLEVSGFARDVLRVSNPAKKQDELPTTADMIGLVPDMTGERTVVEHVRWLRGDDEDSNQEPDPASAPGPRSGSPEPVGVKPSAGAETPRTTGKVQVRDLWHESTCVIFSGGSSCSCGAVAQAVKEASSPASSYDDVDRVQDQYRRGASSPAISPCDCGVDGPREPCGDCSQ